jgi:hypothetical protein
LVGKIKTESGSLARLAFDSDKSVMRSDNTVHHRQSKASSFAPRFGGKEGLKNMS